MPTPPNPLMFPLAMMNYVGSMSELKRWSEESPFLKSVNQNHAQKLEKAVETEARQRFQAWMDGLSRYTSTPHTARPVLSGKPIWQQGAVTLYNYGGKGEPLLVIPSLINRSYVLDMEPRRSLMRFLSRHAGKAHLLDWGNPEEEPINLDIAQYITQRLEPAIDLLYATHGKPVNLVGYCMGGLLAMAASIRQPHKIGKLALLATPWDFHAQGMQQPPAILPQAEWDGVLPHEFIHNWFYLQKPWSVHEKFARFAKYKENSPRLKEFLKIEQWLQDGVGMSAKVAQECFIGWASENKTNQGKWQIEGQPILPNQIQKPTFLAIPERDGIVPPASTIPLVNAWPHAHIHRIQAGHISMIAGSKALDSLWKPLASWLLTNN